MSTWKARGRGVRGQRSQIGAIPAPTGGWNARDVLSAMAPNDAITLENWIADVGSVRQREGYSSWGTGITGSFVETLMQYSPPSGSNKLFAAATSRIFDVTAQGAGISSLTGQTNGRWSHVMFSNTTGNYLYICNGADTPQYYDGASWTNTTFTASGLTVANLDFVHVHLNRLWFIEKNTLNAWYAPIATIGGALTLHKLDLGAFCNLGGKLVAMGSWTRDGGTGGTDDVLVFVTSKGQVPIYSGTDPADASSGGLMGVFKVAEPIGRRCMIRLGSDLAILTSQGLVSMLQTLPQTEGQRAASTITDKIIVAMRNAYKVGSTLFGWQVIEYSKKNLLIINIPVAERATQVQFVMNTRTGAWSKFTNINAGCWGHLGDEVYIGGNSSTVYKFEGDTTDAGNAIVSPLQTAYTDLGFPGNKKINRARGLFMAPNGYSPQIFIKKNFDTSTSGITVIGSTATGTAWDVGSWDTTSWGPTAEPSYPWQTVNGEGIVISGAFTISSKSTISFNSAEIAFETGGML